MEGGVTVLCPVCDSAEALPYVDFDVLRFDECTRCGTVYRAHETPDLLPRNFYEKSYFHGRKSGRDKRFNHRVRKATRQIKTMMRLKPLHTFLDVGCSLGYVVEAGRQLGLQSAGCDISEYAVETCRARGLRAEVGTLEALPFSAGEFDGITIRHTLEHTPTPKQALAELFRISKPGGLMLVMVPDLAYWKGQYRRKTYRYFRPDDLGQQHYVYYTQSSLTRLLDSSGFRVVASSKAVKPSREGTERGLSATLRYRAMVPFVRLGAALRLRRELYLVAERA